MRHVGSDFVQCSPPSCGPRPARRSRITGRTREMSRYLGLERTGTDEDSHRPSDGKFLVTTRRRGQWVGRNMAQIQTELTSKLSKFIPEPVITAALKTMDGYRESTYWGRLPSRAPYVDEPAH